MKQVAILALFIALLGPSIASAATHPATFITPSGAVITWEGKVVSLPQNKKPDLFTGNPAKLCKNYQYWNEKELKLKADLQERCIAYYAN